MKKFIFSILIFMAFLVIKPPGQIYAADDCTKPSFVAGIEHASPVVFVAQEKGGELLFVRCSNLLVDQVAFVSQSAEKKTDVYCFISPQRSIELNNYHSQDPNQLKHPPSDGEIAMVANQMAIYLTKIGSATSV